MDCPHCGKAFHDNWSSSHLWRQNAAGSSFWRREEGGHVEWYGKTTICPACNDIIVRLLALFTNNPNKPDYKEFQVYPQNILRKPTPKEVPQDIKDDYEEACNVIPISHKASAALSRRCLQAILRGQGYNQKDLAQQIDALLKEPSLAKAIPTALRDTVDVIRSFGNFSAHPITDQTTLQIIEVEEGEAEWCLEILDEMFDHYYVKPQRAADRKAALNAKLAAAGKPHSK